MWERFIRQPNRNIDRTALQDYTLHDYSAFLKNLGDELHFPRCGGAVFGIPNEDHAAPTGHGCPKVRKRGTARRLANIRNQQQPGTESQRGRREQAKAAQ